MTRGRLLPFKAGLARAGGAKEVRGPSVMPPPLPRQGCSLRFGVVTAGPAQVRGARRPSFAAPERGLAQESLRRILEKWLLGSSCSHGSGKTICLGLIKTADQAIVDQLEQEEGEKEPK